MAAALLPPQVTEALSALELSCPRSVRPARDVLRRLGAHLGGGPLPVGSALTAAGVPLELTLRAGHADEVRYTVDPSALGWPPGQVWPVATTVLPGIERARRQLDRLTAGGKADDDCWLGVRHRGGATEAKLYRRVRSGGVDSSWALPVVPVLAGAGEVGVVEIYGRVRGRGRRAVHAALAWAGGADSYLAIEAVVADLRGCLTTAAWDGIGVGVSRRLAPGEPAVGTVFLHGVDLFRDDVAARAGLLDLAERLGVAMPGYRDVTGRLRVTTPPLVHGIVGLTALPAGGVAPSVTVAVDERLAAVRHRADRYVSPRRTWADGTRD